MAEGQQQHEQLVVWSTGFKGNLESYDIEIETFSSWFERFELYCELNALNATQEEVQKKNLFLTTVGSKHYSVIRRCCLPDKPRDKTLEQLKEVLINKYEPQGLVTTNRYAFSQRNQLPAESLKEFIEVVQELSMKCNFGDNLEDQCRDRLVGGMRSDNLRRKLLSEYNLTFQRAKEIVQREEAITEYAKVLQQSSHINKVSNTNEPKVKKFSRYLNQSSPCCQCSCRSHQSSREQDNRGQGYQSQSRFNKSASSSHIQRKEGQSSECYRCGRKHNPTSCPAKFWECYKCHRKGHIAPLCKSRVRVAENAISSPEEECNSVTEDSEEVEEEEQLEEIFGNVKICQVKVMKSLNIRKKGSPESEQVVLESLNGNKSRIVQKNIYKSESISKKSLSNSLTESRVMVKSSEQGINKISHKPELVTLEIESKNIQMEIDCGAALSIMSYSQFKALFPNKPIDQTGFKLSSVSGKIRVKGEVRVNVGVKGQFYTLPLIICLEDGFVPLLGRNWLDTLSPDWRSISDRLKVHKNSMSGGSETVVRDALVAFKRSYTKSFRESAVGFIEGFTANLVLKEQAIPVFHKSYQLPHGLEETVKLELLRMEREGKLKRVMFSEWASPIWPVRKKDGGIRICADVSRTLNPNLKIDIYPLPRIESILQEVSGKACYVVIDLSEAYLQLKVNPKCQELLTINTPLGLFQFNALIFGVASAPSIFQSIIDQILSGIKSVKCYLDDIIIGEVNIEQCVQVTHEVLRRLDKHNVRIKESKCIWFKSSVEYLGHQLDSEGYHPTETRVKAILEAKRPGNVTELKSYTGMLNFYSRFMPHMSRDLKPLYKLTEKNVTFEWSDQCQEAFEHSKKKLVSHDILVPYDPLKPLIVSSDASPYGLGCVLSHLIEIRHGKSVKFVEKPIMFASSTLNQAQQRYSQVEREGLGVVFALKKFYKYVWGRKFKLVIDNAPLKSIFNPNKSLSILATDRLIRWSLFIKSFHFEIEHRKSALLAPADAMSRLPGEERLVEPVYNLQLLPGLPLTVPDVARASRGDSVISKVIQLTRQGWTNRSKDPALLPYYNVRFYLSLERDCLMFGNRIVVPQSLHGRVLSLLHEGHPGIVRCKMLARENVWWPALNSDIGLLCQSCEACSIVNFRPVTTEKVPWPKTKHPVQRCHIDFFQFKSKHFLILVDSYSKWIEVWLMSSCNGGTTIQILRMFFATAGLPIELVSDNGPPFDSSEYSHFCTSNNILTTFSPPYHPESNGMAERCVQTVKRGLKKLVLQGERTRNEVPIEQLLASFLLSYRTTPSTVTGRTPASLWLNFIPRTQLSLINPRFQYSERSYSNIPFREGDRVNVRLSARGPVVEAIAIRSLGANRFLVSMHGVLKSVSLNQVSLAPLPSVGPVAPTFSEFVRQDSAFGQTDFADSKKGRKDDNLTVRSSNRPRKALQKINL